MVRDYVILHELMHLRQANHSRAFWREVPSVCPDWREAERVAETQTRPLIALCTQAQFAAPLGHQIRHRAEQARQHERGYRPSDARRRAPLPWEADVEPRIQRASVNRFFIARPVR